MEAADVRGASARVIVALTAAGRSRTTIKRHAAEFNAFAGFLEARGRAFPTEVDCLDFIAERSGVRLAGPARADPLQACSARTPTSGSPDGGLERGRPPGRSGHGATG